jgi:hypothetical protein
MAYTLAAAAAATGTNKTTILRAIKGGKITGTKDAHGQWFVEPAEVHRVYPAVADAVGNAAVTPQYAMADAAELALAQQRAAQAEERLTELKALVEDLRRDRDAWHDQAQGRLLPMPGARVSWWRWLRTTGRHCALKDLKRLNSVKADHIRQGEQLDHINADGGDALLRDGRGRFDN